MVLPVSPPQTTTIHAAEPRQILRVTDTIGLILGKVIGAGTFRTPSLVASNAGGDYHFLKPAFGHRLVFLFAWARLAVIQTGSIALLAFLVGDYAARLVGIDHFPPGFLSSVGSRAAHRAQRGGVCPASAVQNILASGVILGLLVFCATNGYLLYASLAYTGVAALIGMAVLGLGAVFFAGLSLRQQVR